MRATLPVFKNADRGGQHVFRYADVSRVLSESATCSSDAQRMALFEGVEGKVTKTTWSAHC